jgi:hypothetical protein
MSILTDCDVRIAAHARAISRANRPSWLLELGSRRVAPPTLDKRSAALLLRLVTVVRQATLRARRSGGPEPIGSAR